MPLIGLAEGYLQSLGYETTLRGTDLMIGNRLSIAGERDTILVWVPAFKPGQPFSLQEIS